jgi:hypothetical protein
LALFALDRAMVTEKRKAPRKTLDRPGWIMAGDGGEPRECRVCDVSQRGARLGVERVNEVPDYFVLRLSVDGRVSRHCIVVWRTRDEVGVEFVSANEAQGLGSARPSGAKTLAHA